MANISNCAKPAAYNTNLCSSYAQTKAAMILILKPMAFYALSKLRTFAKPQPFLQCLRINRWSGVCTKQDPPFDFFI